MPRIVAHPSEAKTTKNNAEKSNLFFLILLLPCANWAGFSGGDPKCFDFQQDYINTRPAFLFSEVPLFAVAAQNFAGLSVLAVVAELPAAPGAGFQ